MVTTLGDARRKRVEVKSVLRPNHIKGFVYYTKELEFLSYRRLAAIDEFM